MTERRDPKYNWRRTMIDAHDPPTDFDWIGYDGAEAIGRVRKEMHGPIKGKWQWAGWYPKKYKGSPPTPNLGYSASCRLAMLKCEEYWEATKRLANLPRP